MSNGRWIVAYVKVDGFTFYLAPRCNWTCDLQAAETFVSVDAAKGGVTCSGIPPDSLDLVNFQPVVKGWVFAT